MRTRDVAKFAFMFAVASFTGLAAASCGSPSGSKFTDGGVGAHDSGFVNTVDSQAFGSMDGTMPTPTPTCTKESCSALGFDCGMNTDGCNGTQNCGDCPTGQFCGGGGYSKCGTMATVRDAGADGGGTSCVPKTCEQLGLDCGWAADGCGGLVLCGTAADGGATTLATAADGGVPDAGPATCPAPEYCGGGGPNKCGGNTTLQPDGAPITPPCTPKSCADQGFNCGNATDGCNNPLPASCGTCPLSQFCGGGAPNVCGGSTGLLDDGGVPMNCTPKTCADLGMNCGPQGDGCGNLIPGGCGTCTSPAYCGGGGAPGVCGGSVFTDVDGGMKNVCTPTNSCAAQGFTCGTADDGCGNVLNCGTCTGLDTCGGNGVTGQCGHPCPGSNGLCAYQPACTGAGQPTTTTITGTVFAGQSAWTGLAPDPVPNVLVYIPNDPVPALPQGYTAGTCSSCGADITSSSPIAMTYTNFDGTFTLQGVPTPPGPATTIPLVIELGRWRRQFTIAIPTVCTTSQVMPTGGTAGVLNLPRNQTEGNIPFTAISTGAVDALECVILKMGVDQAEFTASSGTGRINIFAPGPNTLISDKNNNAIGPGSYIADPASRARPPAALSQPEEALMGGAGNTTFMNYDQLLFPCWGNALTFTAGNGKSADEPGNLITYADSGGHFFVTHYSYSWLVNNGEFNDVAVWNPNFNNPGNVNWTLNVSTAPPVVTPPLHGGIFWQWLNLVNALSNDNLVTPPAQPQVSINNPRHDADGVANGSVDWIDGTDPQKNTGLVEHFTFNTPVHSANQCGHAIFSDFHVSGVSNGNSTPFPNECTKTFSAQERILEYMLFDLASCVTPPTVTCTPKSCADQGLNCGSTSDGCGNTLDCGQCPMGEQCGGGGVSGVCGAPPEDSGVCTPTTCTAQHIACGPAGDGCGGLIAGGCGTCPAGQTCGGGGVTGQCGAPDGGSCVPTTCTAQHIACGPAGDGCGNLITGGCGTCPPGDICSGGQCVTADGGVCTPETCEAQGLACGPAGDGCGNVIQCGTCPAGQTCGGGGVPGQCAGCQPYTCADLGYNCGPAGDGCGNVIQCGTCPTGETCGGGGTPGRCGAPAPPP